MWATHWWRHGHQCCLFMTTVYQADCFIASFISGTSSVALAWSGTFDDLIGGHISRYFAANAPMGLTGLAPYPDIFAASLILILSGKRAAPVLSSRWQSYIQQTLTVFSMKGVLAFGVKESTTINKIFTAVNILVLLFVTISGFIKGDISNWQISPGDVLNSTIG